VLTTMKYERITRVKYGNAQRNKIRPATNKPNRFGRVYKQR